MKAFLSAVVVALVVAVGAAYILDGSFQRPSSEANTSTTGVRLSEPAADSVGY